MRPSPRTHNLSASLIFPSKELRHYLRFRRQTTTTHVSFSELDRLPSATLYASYLAWRKAERATQSIDALAFDTCPRFESLAAHLHPRAAHSNSSSDQTGVASAFTVARSCRHALHPGTPYPSGQHPEQCPVCIIDVHLQYMGVLTRALNESGGPVRPRDEPESRHENLFKAWYCGKLEVVRVVYQLEQWAADEGTWRRLYPDMDVQGVHSAKEALERYWVEELHINAEAAAIRDRRVMEKGKKRVRFGEDTSFEAGRCEFYFWRRSPRYEEGKYACSAKEKEREQEPDEETEAGSTTDEDEESEMDSDMAIGTMDIEFDEKEDESEDEDGETSDEDSSSDEEEDSEDEEFMGADGADFIVFGD
ncbi:hypothetical protein K505DRAFT_256578 [Melanomma pulvis-pyrius CBS 109.77]|uniref:Uncharacterized protein n=1 Tax=Melanomma pulvis-pyrius CBS 109.77 TaxID=1314802 RepID=A0A6A6WV54_9PLEO|nr:hypothetical protein K505DRAFT_256578 [Melanomma pulvis-pyrius CBS 109.77]